MAAPGHNLPVQLTSFVGRGTELAEVGRLLADSRLLTLTGVGGVGKTRLALELARRRLGRFDDGVRFVDLAPLHDPRTLPQAVAAAVGAIEHPERPPLETLLAQLSGRRLLLVLDNCERLVEGCAELAHRSLQACPGLTVLATSREPLRVTGEQTWTVPPLSPEEGRELLRERVRLSRPDIRSSPRTEEQLDALSAHLDRLPLALELAAAALRSISLEDLLGRLGSRLDLLDVGPRTAAARQRTLRATVEWSHDLLGEPERALFRRLGVFAGGFRLDDAEAVCAGEPIDADDVVGILRRLVDRSLLMPDDGRYRLLETLREYARERLIESAEAAIYERRHAERFLALAELADRESRSTRQLEWMDRLARELDNLRAALAWWGHADPERRLRLAAVLGWFWAVHGSYAEGRAALRAALEGGSGAPPVRGRALVELGTLVRLEGGLLESQRLIEEGTALLRALGEPGPVARALQTLGVTRSALGDDAGARAAFEESLAKWVGLEDPWGVATSRLHLGRASLREGDLATARRLVTDSAEALRKLEAGAYAAEALLSLGIVARLQGDDTQAMASLREALAVARRVGSRLAMPTALEALAGVAASSDAERALRLAGAAAALREAIGLRPPPWWPGLVEGWLAPARDTLPPVAARAQEARGRAMALEEAVAYALGEAAVGGPLTGREREVAELVAQGLTNRQIAERLVVSVRTAEGHVERIRSKLGVRTRAQIAAWVQDR